MKDKTQLLIGLMLILALLMMLSQPVLAYTYPGSRQHVDDMSGWHWLFYTITFIAIAAAIMSFTIKGRLSHKLEAMLGGIALCFSLALGVFLTVISLVKIPLGRTIRMATSNPSGVSMSKNYLYAPSMAPLGISMLVIGIVLLAVYARREIKT